MNFLGSLQQVVSEVTSSVSNLGLSPKRFPFTRDNSQGGEASANHSDVTSQQQNPSTSTATNLPNTSTASAAAAVAGGGGGGHGRGSSASSRLGPKLLPTPGATGSSHSARGVAGGMRNLGGAMAGPAAGMGRGKPLGSFHQGPAKKEKEMKPLPVLQCGDRYAYWPEYDPSQTW